MENLSVKAYNIIKEMILNGELKQGTLISINNLASQLQISRTPLTNAFQRLEHEHFITIVPKQGVIVNAIPLETAHEIYELRAAIESYNAKRVLSSITDDDLSLLEASVEKQVGHIRDNLPLAFMKEDMRFHKFFIEKVSNSEVMSLIDVIYDRSFLLGLTNSSHKRMVESVEEHRKILDAIRQKDKQKFADAVEFNILNGYRNLTTVI